MISSITKDIIYVGVNDHDVTCLRGNTSCQTAWRITHM